MNTTISTVIESVKVYEAYTRDVGRGVIRIDYDTMDKLGCSTGDILEIKGKRRTVAKCLPLYPSDECKNMCRCDGMTRTNLGIAIGNTITVKKIIPHSAQQIQYNFVENTLPIDDRYLTDAFESIPCMKGDILLIAYFGSRVPLKILSTKPKGCVVITTNTIFNSKPDLNKVICPTCGQEV